MTTAGGGRERPRDWEVRMPAVSTERLADVFVEFADTLIDDYDVIEFLLMVTNRTAELIGASDVGLLLADQRGRLQFMAASNEDIKRLELFQVQVDDGPCRDAFQSGRPVLNSDLQAVGDRWPRFAPLAAAEGYRSAHAFPLRLRQEVIGAIGALGMEVRQWDEAEIHVAQALAHMATIGLLQERAIRRGEVLAEQLQSALNSRIVLEQAKGAIAEFRNVSVDDAFLLMRDHARRAQLRLGDVAHAALRNPASLSEVAAPAGPEPA
jgi:GAF domain-containing protein